MTKLSNSIDRIAPTRRPEGRPVQYQSWSNLSFVHWRMPPEKLAPLIPDRLTVDTWQGDAWVGLVPFHMSGVRLSWMPAVPGISTFHETNLRTYVHLDGKNPGVWFFSLDAANSLAVRVARWRWQLPYYRSMMKLRLREQRVTYESRRLWPGTSNAELTLEAEFGDFLPPVNDLPAGQAAPDTLEHFLAERYFLYSQSQAGRLFRGQVHHRPYPLREARVLKLHETMRQAAKLDCDGDHEHVLFSEGVDVEIFGLRQV